MRKTKKVYPTVEQGNNDLSVVLQKLAKTVPRDEVRDALKSMKRRATALMDAEGGYIPG